MSNRYLTLIGLVLLSFSFYLQAGAATEIDVDNCTIEGVTPLVTVSSVEAVLVSKVINAGHGEIQFFTHQGELLVKVTAAKDKIIAVRGKRLFKGNDLVFEVGQPREAVYAIFGEPIEGPGDWSLCTFEGDQLLLCVGFDTNDLVESLWLSVYPMGRE